MVSMLKVVAVRNIKLPGLKKYVSWIKNAKCTTHIGFNDSDTYPDGKKVSYIAYLNEYGDHNPPRPFMKRTVNKNRRKWVRTIRDAFRGYGVNPSSIRLAYEKAGEVAVEDVKTTIREWSPSDPRLNKPSTIKRKARRIKQGKSIAPDPTTALIDSGVMLNSVMYEVRKE